MQASAIEIDRQREKMRSFSDTMLAPFQAFELFAARFAAEHETLENWYRGLRFYHQHVWDAALRVARDAAHLDELLSHWQNLPDDTTRDTFVAMLAEVANEN